MYFREDSIYARNRKRALYVGGKVESWARIIPIDVTPGTRRAGLNIRGREWLFHAAAVSVQEGQQHVQFVRDVRLLRSAASRCAIECAAAVAAAAGFMFARAREAWFSKFGDSWLTMRITDAMAGGLFQVGGRIIRK